MNAFRLPTTDKRVTILGSTGSGKTQFGTWLLSHAPFDKMPYIIVDFKYDRLLNASDKINEIGISDKLPKHPGLYIVHPHPSEEEQLEKMMFNIWEQEKIGFYVDEGYMLPKGSEAFQAILTQGRSKRVPAIVLSQRPVWLSRFVFSEADFYSVFRLNDARDRQTIQSFLPRDRLDVNVRLPKYNSMWYDVGNDEVFRMMPVPKEDEILDRIESRMPKKARQI